MDKDKESAVSKFLEESEETSPFKQEENIFDAAIEPKEEVEEKEEKPLPYHKDEKLQKYISKEVEKRIKDFTPAAKEVKESDEYKDVMDAMTAAIGNDTPEKQNALKAYETALRRIDERSANIAEQKLAEIAEREEAEEREAYEELDNAFESIEENFGVDLTRNQKMRSEFLTYVERIAPKDNEGGIINYPDMNSAWETFSERRTAVPSRAKQLASQGLSRSSETSPSVQGKRPTFDMDIEDMIGGTK